MCLFFCCRMRYILLAVACLACAALGDKPSSGYGAPAAVPPQPQVKYGGPIVYSAEKPPIIHFPPPPRQVIAQKSLFLRGRIFLKAQVAINRNAYNFRHHFLAFLLCSFTECDPFS